MSMQKVLKPRGLVVPNPQGFGAGDVFTLLCQAQLGNLLVLHNVICLVLVVFSSSD